MMYWMYRGVLVLAQPLVKWRLKKRAQNEPEYGQRVAERFGEVPVDVPAGVVWVHSVSAGETIAAINMIERLLTVYPDLPLLVTTMTPTGSAQVTQRLGEKVAHCYAPYDFIRGVRKFFDRTTPRMLILMETELWPNIIREAQSRHVPVVLVNGRLSERSARGYARIGGLSRPMFQALDAVACQTEAHRDRFIALGASAPEVQVTGSVKFDVTLPKFFAEECEELARLLHLDRSLPVWIAASTHPGEEDIVLAAFNKLRTRIPDLQLLLVPRHPVRAPELLELLESAGLNVQRQSTAASGDEQGEGRKPDVFLGDVMGSLLQLYGLADVAFVGGSLVPLGAHNPIEPALCGVPVVCGPHQFNFADILGTMQSRGALVTVSDAEELAEAVGQLIENQPAREQAIAAATRIVNSNRGATDRVMEIIARCYNRSG